MTSEKAIRILVADDHYVVRMGITALVSTEPDMEVVGEAADGNQAVEMFHRLKPNLVLMDLRMPAKDGIAATKEIRAASPNASVLMLTTYDGDTEIHRAAVAEVPVRPHHAQLRVRERGEQGRGRRVARVVDRHQRPEPVSHLREHRLDAAAHELGGVVDRDDGVDGRALGVQLFAPSARRATS